MIEKNEEHKTVVYNLLKKLFGKIGISIKGNWMVYFCADEKIMENFGDPLMAFLFMLCYAVKNGDEWFDKKEMKFFYDLVF